MIKRRRRRSLKAHFDLSRVLDMEIKVRGEKRKRKKREEEWFVGFKTGICRQHALHVVVDHSEEIQMTSEKGGSKCQRPPHIPPK